MYSVIWTFAKVLSYKVTSFFIIIIIISPKL